ncbi:MAG: hypothetical protein CME59_07830 [Halioglobus sp.]|nr:hypothetical protein [Halioglobus sp.]
MKEEHDDLSRPGSQPLPGFEGRSLDNSKRREPLFAGFEEDDAYEEPDRDTDYATGFRQEAVEEEEPLDEHEAFEELLPEDLEADDAALFEEQEAFLKSEAGVDLKRHGGSVSWDDMHRDEEPQEADTDAWYDEDDTDYADDDLDEELEEDSAVTTMKPGEWLDEDPFTAEEDRSGRWPVGLIAVGALALVLVFAGGYGVVQQRAQTEAELVELRAALATAASPEEVSASRNALQQARAETAGLSARNEALAAENQRLADTVAGLEAQLGALQAQAAPPPAQARPAAPTPKPAPAKAKPAAVAKPATPVAAPAPAKPTAAAPIGDWFVNFGSYSQREAAQAWVNKLKPAAGEAVVAQAARDGRTFYRVRVIGLADRAAADKVAAQLQKDWGLPKLWVGRQ